MVMTICRNESGMINIASSRIAARVMHGGYITAEVPRSSAPVKSDSLSLRNCTERIRNIVPKAVVRQAAEAVRISGERNIPQLIKPNSDTGRVLKPPKRPTLTAARLMIKPAVRSRMVLRTHSHNRGRKLHSALSMLYIFRCRRTMQATIVTTSSSVAKRLVWRVMVIIGQKFYKFANNFVVKLPKIS